MSTRAQWHPGEDALQTYVDGVAGVALAASVEAHLLSCAGCRAALAPAIAPTRLAAVRSGLEDRLDAAERPWLERLLRRLGVGEADARVLLAAPSVRGSWWLAVVLALALAVLAAVQSPSGDDTLLLLAPLLPVVATAAAYAPRLDPALALTQATPYPALRRLLLRSGTVAAASTGLAALASVALPIGNAQALVWLLPSAALTVSVLALSTWVDAEAAAAAACTAWLVAVWSATRGGAGALAVYDEAGQLVSAVVLLAATAVLLSHRHRVDPGSPA